MQPSNDNLLSRPVRTDEFSSEPFQVSLGASDEQRREIAERLDIEDVGRFSADLSITKRVSLVTVKGSLKADLGRICVVSLEPMRELIEENFTADFTTEDSGELEGEFEADLDAPEPIEGDMLNLWDVALEQLVLAMSPHPKIEGATAPEDPGAGAKISPFEALKDLQG
jgi:uncharacterized metal-binding protein YceD (DUF177 family)